MTAPSYIVRPYHYAKGKQAVCPTPDGSGFKTRAARLAEGCGGRWTHRAGGYLLSAAGVARFERLYTEGYDADIFTGALVPPDPQP